MAGTFNVVNESPVATYVVCYVNGTAWQGEIGVAAANGGKASYTPPDSGSKSFNVTFWTSKDNGTIQYQLYSYVLDENDWTFTLTQDGGGSYHVHASCSGSRMIHITNRTSQTVGYGVWWGGNAQNQGGLLKAGGDAYYVDTGSSFNIAFYQNGGALIGQSLSTPLGYEVFLTQENGGYGITRQKIATTTITVKPPKVKLKEKKVLQVE